MRWIDTETDQDAANVHFGMWDAMPKIDERGRYTAKSDGPTDDGVFWTERLDKNNPDERFRVASGALPIPAAWRECLIALRAKVRVNRKSGKEYHDFLQQIHHLAAIASIELPYDDLALVPYSRLNELDLSYQSVGCDELGTLNATDRKWMRELWGEPNSNTTAKEMFSDLYKTELARTALVHEQHRMERMKRYDLELDRLHRSEGYPQRESSQKAGCLGSMVWLTAILVPIVSSMIGLVSSS